MHNDEELTPEEEAEFDEIVDNALSTAEDTGAEVRLNESAIANVIEFINDDREKAEIAYNYFMNRIEIQNDQKAATREAMTKALEIKTKAVDQLLELLNIQAKMAAARVSRTGQGAVNININTGEVSIDKRELIKKIEEGEV